MTEAIGMWAAAPALARQPQPEDRLSWRRQWQPATASAAGLPASLRGRETVLVVDEKPILRGAVADVLRPLGYRVLEAADAVEARYHAHTQRKIHLTVMDLPATEIDHLELARWFRAIYPETRVLLAADSFCELNLQPDGSPQFAVLAKPFTPLELARRVRLILDDAVRAVIGPAR